MRTGQQFRGEHSIWRELLFNRNKRAECRIATKTRDEHIRFFAFFSDSEFICTLLARIYFFLVKNVYEVLRYILK